MTASGDPPPHTQVWENHIQKALPQSGEDQQFVLHAVVRSVPPEVLNLPDVHAITSEGWPVDFVLRFGSDLTEGYFGFKLDGNPSDSEAELIGAGPVFGKGDWLQKTQHELLGSANGLHTALLALDTGTYTIELAAPDRFVVNLDGKVLKGRHTLVGSADFWVMRAGEDSDVPDPEHGPEVNEFLKELYANNADWMLFPKSKRGGGKGHHLVDVAKTVAHQLHYQVMKATENERQFTLGLAYPANRLDAHGDFATPDQLERTAWQYMVQRRGVGLMHKSGTDGAGTVVESYIYRGPEWKIGEQVIKSGDWLLGVIWNDTAWKLIKAGDFKGFSIQGWAKN